MDASGVPLRDLEGYREEWNDSFAFAFVDPAAFTDDEGAVWSMLDAIFAFRGGRPAAVKEVLVSETMRLANGEFREACGVWDASTGQIIVKRAELASVEAFAGTVLHECAHAVSGARDVSVAFEDALTVELGRVFVHGRPAKS